VDELDDETGVDGEINVKEEWEIRMWKYAD
jgi:hypothetical protein